MLSNSLLEPIDCLYECADQIDQLAMESPEFTDQLRTLARKVRSSARFAQSIVYLASMQSSDEPSAA